MIKKLPSGKYRLYSRKKDKNGKRKNLGTFDTLEKAKKHEQEIQYFKHTASHDIKSLEKIVDDLKGEGDDESAKQIEEYLEAIKKTNYTPNVIPDNQMNSSGPDNIYSGQIMSSPSWSADYAIASAVKIMEKFANDPDFYKNKDSDKIYDNMLDLLQYAIDMFEQDNIDGVVGANGTMGNSVVENQNSGSFQGLSDAYFYSGSGSSDTPYTI